MRSVLATAICVFCVFFTTQVLAGTPAGESDAVKGWYAPTFESLKDSTQPLIIYIYDAKPKLNHFAEKLESKVFLNNADVATRAKKFRCIRVKSEEKSWPAEWTSAATNGAVLIVASSDRKRIEMFDKNDSSRLTSATLVAVMDSVLSAEPKEPRKIAEKPAAKEKEDAPKENALGIKGLGDDKNKDAAKYNKDPKDEKKTTEKKKDKHDVVDE
jgi:hypothetical protein